MRHNIDTFSTGILTVLLFFSLSFVFYPVVKADTDRKAGDQKTEQKKETGKNEKKAGDKKNSAKKGERIGLPTKEYKESDFKPKGQEESYGWMVFKTLLILGLLVAGFYYFFRFVTKKAGIQVLGQEVIQVVSVVPIGQNKYLQVVDLAGKMLVLGVTDNNINVVSEITDKDEIDRIRLLSSKSKAADKETFQGYITKNISKMIEKVTEKKKEKEEVRYTDPGESGVDLSYLKKQRNRLKKMNGNDN